MNENGRIQLPHMLTRIYLDESTYSVDFYQYYDDKNYICDFIKGIEQLERGFEKSSKASLRSTPFYFTKCTKCSFCILTNRDQGFKIDCQICKFKNICKPFQNEKLNNTIQALYDSKIKIVNRKGQTLFLLIQPSDENKINKICHLCQSEDFQQQDVNGYAGYRLSTQGFQRGILSHDADSMILFRKTVKENMISNSTGTPRSIEKLLQKIRNVDPKINSISMDVDLKENDLTSYLMLDMIDESIDLINNDIEKGCPNVQNLIILYVLWLQKGELEKADETLLLAQIKYPHDPNVLMHIGQKYIRLGNYDDACKTLEEANTIDPVNSSILVSLIFCYKAMGKESLVLETEARLRSMGGFY